MPKVYLSQELCARVRDKMEQLMEVSEEKGINIQHRAADSLLRACQTQERYNLHPMTPADYARAQHKGANPENSEASRLERMTPEELLELQRQAVGDEYPGKVG